MALAKAALPSSQQKRRERLEAKVPPVETPTGAPASQDPPAGDPPANDEGSVTLTAEEHRNLQAAADRARVEAIRADVAALDAEDARVRLTELERTRKEEPTPPAALELGFAEADAILTPEEVEEYSSAESTIRKIVRQEIAKAFKAYDTQLSPRLTKAEASAKQATTVVTESNQKRFMDVVRDKVTDVNRLVQDPNFQAFLRTYVPRTRTTYNTALNDAHADEDLSRVVDIFDDFRTAYKINKPSGSGYNGANPAASSGDPTPAPTAKRFTISERKSKSEDYRKGRIKREELDAYMVEFNKALAEDRVDQ